MKLKVSCMYGLFALRDRVAYANLKIPQKRNEADPFHDCLLIRKSAKLEFRKPPGIKLLPAKIGMPRRQAREAAAVPAFRGKCTCHSRPRRRRYAKPLANRGAHQDRGPPTG